jgi:peroxiredoxin
MKKIIVLIFVIIILTFGLFSGQEEIIKEVRQLYNQKNFTEALKVIEKGLVEIKDSSQLIKWKFYTLMELKRYDDALVHVEKNITDPADLAGAKFYIFKQQGKYEKALEMALEKEKSAKRKSPWSCFDLIELYIKLNNKEKAMDWLDEAVKRGFISFMFLYEKDFALIQNEDRFKKAVDTMKARIGIDQAAKDFSVKMLNGDTFTLSEKKGQVILIDFWATWCGPCRAEIPNLKQYYAELNARGFEIIGVSLDSDRQKLDTFVKSEELPWKISFSGQAWKDETAKLYGVNSIPSYWLIDKKGVLRYFGLRKDKLKKAVEALLAE